MAKLTAEERRPKGRSLCRQNIVQSKWIGGFIIYGGSVNRPSNSPSEGRPLCRPPNSNWTRRSSSLRCGLARWATVSRKPRSKGDGKELANENRSQNHLLFETP